MEDSPVPDINNNITKNDLVENDRLADLYLQFGKELSRIRVLCPEGP